LANLPAPPGKPTVYVVDAEPLSEGFVDALAQLAGRVGPPAAAVKSVAAPSAADAAWYRRFVDFLRDEYNAVGAVMLSHASTLFEHAQQMFDELDDDVPLLGEIGVAIRAPGTLTALAPAKTAAQQAYEHIFGGDSAPPEALIIGATAPARALALALTLDLVIIENLSIA